MPVLYSQDEPLKIHQMGHIVKNKQASKQNTHIHYKMDATERYMKQKKGP